jgi:hypothetical protein
MCIMHKIRYRNLGSSALRCCCGIIVAGWDPAKHAGWLSTSYQLDGAAFMNRIVSRRDAGRQCDQHGATDQATALSCRFKKYSRFRLRLARSQIIVGHTRLGPRGRTRSENAAGSQSRAHHLCADARPAALVMPLPTPGPMLQRSGAGTLVYAAASVFPSSPSYWSRRSRSPLRAARSMGAVALCDALAALAPPEKPIAIEWPHTVHVDSRLVGGGRLAWPDGQG